MQRLDRLTERLNLKEFQLRALLEVTKAINANVGRDDLLRLYGDIVRHELGITRLMLFERTTTWACILAFGTQGEERTIDVDAASGSYGDIQLIGPEQEAQLGGFDIAVPVSHEDRPLAFLFIGDIDEGEQRMSPTVKHLNFIQTLTNLIVVALENQRLNRQALQQERDKRELELAAEMQSMLVPDALPSEGPFRAAAWYQPHRQVGGDYYDVIRVGTDEVVIVIADVSGKGIAAALLMSNFQATLRALVQYSDDPLDELVHDLNDKVFSSARGERFITAFIGRMDLRTGRLQYVNAGHNPPLLLGNDLGELSTGSIALGMMPKLPFMQVGGTELSSGALLLCYTDGLVEQEDTQGNAFGTDPLRRAMEHLRSGGPDDLVRAVVAHFDAHRGTEPYLDDIAVLACRLDQ